MLTRRFSLWLRYAIALVVLGQAGGAGFAQVASESQLKAAYLVSFLKYVEWPSSHAMLTLCLFGRGSFVSYLANYEGRQVAGREFHVRRITSHDQLAGCDALFVPETDEIHYANVLRWADKRPILTVGDTDSFLRDGGAIAFVSGEGRLQFDINTDAIGRAGLKAHSQMLRLARKVTGASR